MIELINDDCTKVLNDVISNHQDRNIILVSDPPFNIRYHYNEYKDNKKEKEYYNMLWDIFGNRQSVIIHYPEQLHKISLRFEYAPEKIATWVYNANTAKQHRDIAFYNIKPDFEQVRQPYKDYKDKRIQKLVENGSEGARLYDWWECPQVKNKTKNKLHIKHPCQMPLKIMENVIGILPVDSLIIDPFLGSGTTAEACLNKGYDFIGIEINQEYYDYAKERIGQ